jgi:hypothetical protein
MFWIEHGPARLLVACLAACALVAVGACSNSQTGKKQPLIVTVGHDNADVIGDDNVAIQKAVDRVAAAGGGVVRIKAGTYIFSNWVRLASHMTIEGEGADKTILKKGPRVASRVTVDADSTETEATVEDASPFKPGMGVVVFDDHLWCRYPYVRTVLRIEGSKLIFDDILEVDHAAAQSAMASNCFPLIAGINVEDDQVRNLTVEGNRTGKEPYAEAHLVDPSALLFYGSKKFSIRGVVARNFAGDGISAWYAEDPTIEDCESYGNTGLGIHLGSRALRGQVRHNRSHNNHSDGIYLCWGVQHGRWEENESIANDGDGISIGHKDTDNIFIKNVVRENGKAGVYFRDDPEGTAGHRNSLRENIIENNGRLSHPGYGIRIDGATQHIELTANTIRETRTGAQARQNVGLYIGPQAGYVIATQNEFSGAMQQKIQDKSTGGHNKFE